MDDRSNHSPFDSEPEREPDEDDNFHPRAILLGFAVVVALVIGAWFIFTQSRCNPLFSDAGLAGSQSCR